MHIYVCVSNMWHYSRLGSRQFTPSLSILHIKMTHITSHSLSFRSLFYGYFLIVFFLSFLQTKPNNVWSSSNRHRVSFAPKISNTQKECSFTMLVHLCKSIHYNQLHEYSKVVFNTFGTVSFMCFSPLLHFFLLLNVLFERFRSFDWDMKIYLKPFTVHAYLCCWLPSLLDMQKKYISHIHKMHHTAPSIDSWFILHCIALPCILINRFWLQIKQKSNYSSVYTVSTLHPRSVCQ